MLNPLNLISRFIKSSNQKELDKIQKYLEGVDIIKEIYVPNKLINFVVKNK